MSHAVESSSMPVSAPQWDQTVAWFIQNYAGLFPLQARMMSHTVLMCHCVFLCAPVFLSLT